MRISREYFFDLVELVGKAITTARKKAAGPEWNMDEQLEIFMRRHQIDNDDLEKAIRKAAAREDDHWNVFGDSGWKDSAQDGNDGAVDERENRQEFSKYGSEAFEQRKCQREKDQFGDGISCQLWELQRQVRFGETKVVDALKDLQQLCHRLAGFISAGWGNRLAQIIDHWSR